MPVEPVRPESAHGPRLSTGKKLLFAATFTGLSLIALEGVCRWIGFEEPKTIRLEYVNPTHESAMQSGSLFRNHATLLWELRPGSVDVTGRDRPNEATFRGPLVPRSKSAHVFRIAVMGDSCTYGVQLTLEQTYGSRLEQQLARRHRDRTIEVINAGVPGYSIQQGNTALQEKLIPYSPDLIVLYFGAFNDGKPAAGRADVEWSRGRSHESSGFSRLDHWLLQSHLYRGLSSGVAAALSVTRGEPTQQELWNAWMKAKPIFGVRVPPQDFEELLVEMITSCEKRSIEVLIILPELNRSFMEPAASQSWVVQHRRHLEIYREILERVATERGVPTVDQRKIAERVGDTRTIYCDEDPVHPDSNGALRLAWALQDCIETEGWIEERTVSGPSALRLSLDCDRPTVSSGERELTFRLDAGVANRGRRYFLIPSARARRFRFRAPDVRVPLEIDRLARLAFQTVERESSPWSGQLDELGCAEATVTLPEQLDFGELEALGFVFLCFRGKFDPQNLRLQGSFVSNDLWLRVERGS